MRATSTETAYKLFAPFHPEFPKAARALGGKWDGFGWVFRPALRNKVNDLCRKVYGRAPGDPTEYVDLTLRFEPGRAPGGLDDKQLWALGRLLLERPDRDAEVAPGPMVAILEGEFSGSGGSRNHPKIGQPDGPVTLLVEKVPAAFSDGATLPEGWEVVDGE